jgi:hypothetical protein
LGHYIDQAEPKGNIYSCARICVEINLEKGLSEGGATQYGGMKSHLQALNYEKIPFKCNTCGHEYGHFAKRFPIIQEIQPPPKQSLNPSNEMEA